MTRVHSSRWTAAVFLAFVICLTGAHAQPGADEGPSFGQINPAQMARMLNPAEDGPFYMINLIQFREKAVYPDGRETDLTGQEANNLYRPIDILEEIGAEVVFTAQVEKMRLGDGTQWDQVAIARYPSRRAFLQMTQRPDFRARSIHKDAGVGKTIVMVSHLIDLPTPEGSTPPEPAYPATAINPRYLPYPGVYSSGYLPGMFRRRHKLEENRKGMHRYLSDMDRRLAADQPEVVQFGIDVSPHERQVYSAILAAEYPQGRDPDFQNTGEGARILLAWQQGQRAWAASPAQRPTARPLGGVDLLDSQGSVTPLYPDVPAAPPTADDRPFEMIHVLRYRAAARYEEGSTEPAISGREAMKKYGSVAGPMGVHRTAWFKIEGVLIGDGRPWDEVRINHFPSHATLAKHAESEVRAEAQRHRAAALEDRYAIQARPLINRLGRK